MAKKPNIAVIVKYHDSELLREAMRFGPDARVRQEAVRASARMGDYEYVEVLNRALREDPDEDVRKEARTALEEILGNRANEVISSYDCGESYEDEWLILDEETPDEPAEIKAEWDPLTFTTRFSHQPNVSRIVADKDLTALVGAMRFGPDAKVRLQAVKAAGKLGNYDLIEALTRSIREDPEESVRQAAYDALYEMLGRRADEVISSYTGRDGYEDEWVQTAPVEAVEDDPDAVLDEDLMDESLMDDVEEAPEGEWDENSMSSLFRLANDRSDPRKAVRAVRALASINTTRAVEALIYISLHAQVEEARFEAVEQLRGFYGDDLEEVWNSYKDEDLGFSEEIAGNEEGDEPEKEEWMDLPQERASIRQTPTQAYPSTLREEGMNPLHVVMVIIGVLVVIGLIALELGR